MRNSRKAFWLVTSVEYLISPVSSQKRQKTLLNLPKSMPRIVAMVVWPQGEKGCRCKHPILPDGHTAFMDSFGAFSRSQLASFGAGLHSSSGCGGEVAWLQV